MPFAVVSTLRIHFIIPPSKKERQKKDGKAAVRSQINIYNIARYKKRRCYLSSNIIDTAACKGKLFSFYPLSLQLFQFVKMEKFAAWSALQWQHPQREAKRLLYYCY
jgi:hypothetical protein